MKSITLNCLLCFVFLGALVGIESACASAARDDAADMAGRHRWELGLGYWDSGQWLAVSSEDVVKEEVHVQDLAGSFTYAYGVGERLMTQISFRTLVAEANSLAGPVSTQENTVVISSALFGLRYYPLLNSSPALRPYVSASVGPYVGVEHVKNVNFGRESSHTRTLGVLGARVEAGFDIPLGRHFLTGIGLGYNLMEDFDEPLAGKTDFEGLEISAGFSLLI